MRWNQNWKTSQICKKIGLPFRESCSTWVFSTYNSLPYQGKNHLMYFLRHSSIMIGEGVLLQIVPQGSCYIHLSNELKMHSRFLRIKKVIESSFFGRHFPYGPSICGVKKRITLATNFSTSFLFDPYRQTATNLSFYSHISQFSYYLWNAWSQPQREKHLWKLWNTDWKEDPCTAEEKMFKWNPALN